MTLAGTLEMIAERGTRPPGRAVLLPESRAAVRHRSAAAGRGRGRRRRVAAHRSSGRGRCGARGSGAAIPLDLIRLVAPTTPHRANRRGGRAGPGIRVPRRATRGDRRVDRHWRATWRSPSIASAAATPLPIAVGFGVSTPAQAPRWPGSPTASWWAVRWLMSSARRAWRQRAGFWPASVRHSIQHEPPSVMAYIALGSNLGDRRIPCLRPGTARRAGRRHHAGRYPNRGDAAAGRAGPAGLPQPDGGGADDVWRPGGCLSVCHDVERRGRRRRSTKWCSRTLDLDLVRYGDLLCDLPDLVLPHPGLRDRQFWAAKLPELEAHG